MTDILQAARSYYGLSDATVRKTEWFTDEGKTILCFEIVTEGEDFIGIVERMKRLQEESSRMTPQENMSHLIKSTNAMLHREVAHIDAPETEEPTTMDAVWLPSWDVPDHMRQFASDEKYVPNDDGGPVAGVRWFLMQSAMLTEEQRQKAKEAKP